MNQSQNIRDVMINAAPIMVKGLKADHHIQQFKLKYSRCPFDAGFDVYPDRADPETIRLDTAMIIKIGTSVNFCFPIGTFGYLCERSSSSEKLGGARVRPGVFDAGYTGECFIVVICPLESLEVVLSRIKIAQQAQHALAQMIVIPTLHPAFIPWEDRKVPPGRGANGFGHSDVFTKS